MSLRKDAPIVGLPRRFVNVGEAGFVDIAESALAETVSKLERSKVDGDLAGGP